MYMLGPKTEAEGMPITAGAALLDAEHALVDANLEQAAAALKVAVLRSAVPYAPLRDCALFPARDLVETRQSCTARAGAPTLTQLDDSDEQNDKPGLVFIVDQDPQVRNALRRLIEASGLRTRAFADGEGFLAAYQRQDNACLLADTDLADLGGLTLLLRLGAAADPLPVILTTDSGDVPRAVQAMQAGAADFIEKPIGGTELIASVTRALEGGRIASGKQAVRTDAMHHFDALTARQRQVMVMVLAGHASKNIAADLGISQRTVENHRAAIMRKSGSKSLPALARMALAAEK